MSDEQSGFTWEIEFLSDSTGGNLPSFIVVHGDGLRTSNPVRGAEIAVVTGRDGRVSHFLFVSTINVLIESICCFTMSYSFHFSRVVFISLLSYVVQVARRQIPFHVMPRVLL